VAHELNNPLNNIYLSAQVLSKESGEGCRTEVKDAVSDILGQTVRVKQIVGDLLEFARGREPRLQKVNLEDLIRRVYKQLGADTGKVRFSIDSNGGDIVLSADRQQMEQVFINLFTNAVEAMPNGGNLEVHIRYTGDAVSICVLDSGKGIPQESLDKVFEPFFTSKDKGTGLGLAIVFNIIKKHYGEIAVWSDGGRGTIFSIDLPLNL